MNFPYPYSWMTPAPAAGAAVVSAVRLHGNNSWKRNAALVGVANGKTGILSFWFKLALANWDGYAMELFGNLAGTIGVIRQADNKLRVFLYDTTAATPAFDFTFGTFVADATWHHFLASWDAGNVNFPYMQIYIDDVAVGGIGGSTNNINIGYNKPSHIFGVDWPLTGYWDGELAEFYFNQAVWLDLAYQPNRRKFITSTLRPVDLGANGANPTGTAPIWYHSGDNTTFITNKGSGGAFANGTTGTLALASNTPSTVFNPVTKFLCHCDGLNGNAEIYDSSGPVGHPIANFGTSAAVLITTAQSKFGGTSLRVDSATSQYLAIGGSSADFAFGVGDFTIDMWFRLIGYDVSGYAPLYDGRAAEGRYPYIYVDQASGKLIYRANNAIRITGTTTVTTGAWHHAALTRSGTSTRLFLDGVQQGSTYTDSLNYLGSTVYIGCSALIASYTNGYLDEIRVLKGQAAWTANFTPPAAAYVS